MFSWKETFEQCTENRSLLDSALDRGPEVSCTRTFAILPLRYGAVGGSAAQLKLLPSLPAHLSKPQQVAALSAAGYAIRPLRQGFLYVLIKRISNGTYAWHSQYRISELGTLSYIDAHKPWQPAPSASVDADGIKGLTWMFKVNDVDDISDLRLLYSPAPLTEDSMKKYRALPRYRDTLTSIDVAKLACAEPAVMDGVLAQDQLNRVAEFAALDQPRLKELLKTQAYSTLPPPLQVARAEMLPAGTRKEYRGAAIVVHDAIGITQELNTWRNASVEPLDTFMEQKDAENLDNKRKLTVAFAIENIKQLLAEAAEASYYKAEQNIGVRYTDREYEMSNRHAVVQSAGTYRNYRNPTHQQEVQQATARQRRQDSWNKYAEHLNEDRRQAFLKDYQRVVDQADQAKDARADDHLRWLESESFLEALDAFDRNDTEQALLFEDQMGKAIVGMNATAVGEALLERWRAADISRENLFWRSLAQNQIALEDEVKTLVPQQHSLVHLDPQTLQEKFKKLSDLYEKSGALLDALAQSGIAGPPASYLAAGALMINTLGNTLFQGTLASNLDKPLNWLLARVLKSRLGHYSQHFRLEMRDGKALSRGTLGRMDRATSRSFDEALRAGTKGPMAEVRLGGLLVMLEMWNLHNRFNAADKNSREYAELAAAMVGLAAAGLEIGASTAGLAEKSSNAAVQQGAKVFKSGLRLGAGVLAGGAAGVGAWYDYSDFWDNRKLGKNSIAYFHLLRATVQTGAAALSIAIGFASSGSYVTYLLEKHSARQILGKVLLRATQISSTLALRMIPMLRIFFSLNIVVVALVVIEIFFLPDALERYLAHSAFRKDRSNGIADTEQKELEILQRAIGSTL